MQFLNPDKCRHGEEQYLFFRPPGKDKDQIHYDYLTLDGELFSTVAAHLEQARQLRDQWLADREDKKTWDDVVLQVLEDVKKESMCDVDLHVAWRLGLAAWKAARENGASFPHDPKDVDTN